MRSLATALAVLALALAGCGGDGEPGGALGGALAYLPEDAPFAVAIDTDVEGGQAHAAGELADRFPFADQALDGLRERIEEEIGGVSYEEDLKPLLGNPFVVGSVNAGAVTGGSGDGDGFVGAIEVEDAEKLEELIAKSDAEEAGEAAGATLYGSDGGAYAVDDDVLVVAGSRELLVRALERSEGGEHLDEEAFEAALDGLPEKALVRLYADIGALLRSDPSTEGARRIPWVDALGTLGLTVSATDDRLALDLLLATDPEGLGDGELPLAAGEEAPRIVREADIAIGVRDLAHVVRFAEDAGQALDPSSFGDYQAAKAQIERELGVSLDDDILAQLTGDLSVNVGLDGSVGARAELADPPAFERTLEDLSGVLVDASDSLGLDGATLSRPGPNEDLYRLSKREGDVVAFGVVDGSFVIADPPELARRMAAATPEAVPDAEGSLVVSADAEQLAAAILREIGPALDLGGLLGDRFGAGPGELLGGDIASRFVTGPLGELTGSVSTSAEGLRGGLTLTFDQGG